MREVYKEMEIEHPEKFNIKIFTLKGEKNIFDALT